MTPVELKLCRDIAEAEFPESVIRIVGEEVYIVEEGYSPRSFPRYLTNPAETVRMLEALIETYGINLRTWREICGPERCKVKIPIYSKSISQVLSGDTFNKPIAEAYKAMMLASKKGAHG